jgi:histidinol dehydrogenase
MRILKLTARIEKSLLAHRAQRDDEAATVAAEIVGDVRKRGDVALFAWAKKLDQVDLAGKGVWISKKEIASAKRRVSTEFLNAIKRAAKNVRGVAEKQLPRAWSFEPEPGIRISQRVSAIESIGCYIPGGNFSLVSTLVMTAVPAQVAGVSRIIAVCPHANPQLLAAASLLGITEIARIGGAQAIAALAYGTKSVPRVEKIFGPGNQYVTAAKQLVSSDCAIDLPAGPTEAIVLAESGNARWIAADLLAQAEHARDAGSFFVTTSVELALQVQREVQWQLAELPLSTMFAKISTRIVGKILIAPSLAAACEFVSRFAPEHLSLPENGEPLLKKLHSFGTVFLGPWGAQPLGDYATGSNHVLPTGGWARKRGGLSAADFVKCLSVQDISKNGFLRLADTVETLAESEGLLGHRNAVRIRR